MSDPLITALIAFTGTLLTVLFGLWQWKRKQENENLQQFQNERKTVYKELWKLLPDLSATIQLEKILKDLKEIEKKFGKNDISSTKGIAKANELYDSFPDEAYLNKCLDNVKMFALEKPVYLDDEIINLSTDYITSLLETKKALFEIVCLIQGEFSWKEFVISYLPPLPTNLVSNTYDSENAGEFVRHAVEYTPIPSYFGDIPEAPTLTTSEKKINKLHIIVKSFQQFIAVRKSALDRVWKLCVIRGKAVKTKLKLKWVEHVFSNPTPVQIKLMEKFLPYPTLKPVYRSFWVTRDTAKYRRKLVTRFRQVLKGKDYAV